MADLIAAEIPVKEHLREAHMRTMLGCGANSPSTLEPLATAKTLSLTLSQDPNETRSLAPLPWLFGKDRFLQQLMTPWLWEQSKIQSWIYLQPSGKMANPTQPRMTTFSLALFYNANSEPTKMPTQRNISKKPSPHASLPKLPNKNWWCSSVQSCNSPSLPFIFAMHSCKYVKVQQQEKQQTKILRLQNLWFFKNGRLANLNDPSLKFANCINITFELQKKDKKNNAVTHMSSGDITLCPVRAAAAIALRIRSYPGANDNTPISAIWQYDRIKHITSRQIKNALWDAILAIGEDTLHIAANKIGTHSICSGAAMAMFLGGCPRFLIMMIGRWSSDAFLRYIRKQVEEFNHNVSCKMITYMFHRHIPNCTSPTVSHLDPRQCNYPDNVKTRRNIGGDMAW
jgi:hypothetical protein